jgi:hypothetical protein
MGIESVFMEKNLKYSSYDYHVYLINIMNSKSLDEKIKYARMLVDMNLSKDANFFGYKTLAMAESGLNMCTNLNSTSKH